MEDLIIRKNIYIGSKGANFLKKNNRDEYLKTGSKLNIWFEQFRKFSVYSFQPQSESTKWIADLRVTIHIYIYTYVYAHNHQILNILFEILYILYAFNMRIFESERIFWALSTPRIIIIRIATQLWDTKPVSMTLL